MNTESLLNQGYTIKNAQIISVDLSMEDHGIITLYMDLIADGFGVIYGGHILGKGYLGAKEFTSSPKAMAYIMHIMDIVNVRNFNDLKGKYLRIATRDFDRTKIIGNIIEDRWFNPEEFFKESK